MPILDTSGVRIVEPLPYDIGREQVHVHVLRVLRVVDFREKNQVNVVKRLPILTLL
jgi:hypothetical protein